MSTKFQPDRSVSSVTNEERAESALTALQCFGSLMGLHGEDIATAAGDLLCNTLHLACACGKDPHDFLQEIMEDALCHYTAESATEIIDNEEEPPFLEEPWSDILDLTPPSNAD